MSGLPRCVELVSMVQRALKIHAVYFYEDAESLSRTVAPFIGAGLVANQPAVVIATPSHSTAILEILWNQFVTTRKCSLLCGYSVEGVGEGTGFKKICDEHSHVVSADNPLPPC